VDYRPLVKFDPEQVREIVEESEAFIKEMTGMLKSPK
jgi:hypothetical protein